MARNELKSITAQKHKHGNGVDWFELCGNAIRIRLPSTATHELGIITFICIDSVGSEVSHLGQVNCLGQMLLSKALFSVRCCSGG